MNAILLESGSEEDIELVLTLARKLGIKTRELSSRQWEDHVLAAEIEQGMETPTVSRADIMKALGKE